MNSSLDLNLLLISPLSAKGSEASPDLLAVTPPRRAARGRDSDCLIIYFSMTGNSPLPDQAQTQILQQLANQFYKTTGSVTAALRSMADSLNLQLLDRNLRSTSAGKQGIGQLLLAAWRSDSIYIAQCGAVQAYSITPSGTLPVYDLQTSGRGLGLSRALTLRFLHIKVAADDYLILSTRPSAGLPGLSLAHPAQAGIDGLRREVTEVATADFSALIIQAVTGKGKLNLLHITPEVPAMDQPTVAAQGSTVEPPQATPAIPLAEISVEKPETGAEAAGQAIAYQKQDQGLATSPGIEPLAEAPEVPEQDEGLNTGASTQVLPEAPVLPVEATEVDASYASEPASQVTGLTAHEEALDSSISTESPLTPVLGDQLVSSPEQPMNIPPAPPPSSQAAMTGQSSEPAIAVGVAAASSSQAAPAASSIPMPQRAIHRRRAASPRPWTKYVIAIQATLARIGAPVLQATRSALATIGAALLRLLKNLLPDADVLRIPPSAMVFLAIVIPLALAVIGGLVFLQRGQAQQQQVYYQQAIEKAAYADTLTNPLEQRLSLETALGDLDKADQFTITSQSQELRSQLTGKLDALDSVKRLDYQRAVVGGLDSTIKVTRIVATTADLYLLNAAQGNVLHAIMTARGYELDPTFQCGPTNGPITVGPLIDIAELPPGGYENASVLGIDSNGNLLYCVVGASPYSATLAPPNTGLGKPIGISLDRGDLYVLDPQVNAVWIYSNMVVSQPPHLFFGDVIPPMQDAIDMAVYNDDLYLLHADGHTTKCTYSGMIQSPTRCDDPYPYSDDRPGRSHGPVLEDAVFSQIAYSNFPERSIYYLEPKNQAIFYFSVLLTLQYQYQPKSPLAVGDATSFAISPNRIAYLAIGNNVYYAAIP